MAECWNQVVLALCSIPLPRSSPRPRLGFPSWANSTFLWGNPSLGSTPCVQQLSAAPHVSQLLSLKAMLTSLSSSSKASGLS